MTENYSEPDYGAPQKSNEEALRKIQDKLTELAEEGVEFEIESARPFIDQPFELSFDNVTFVFINSFFSILFVRLDKDGNPAITDEALGALLNDLEETWGADPLLVEAHSFGFSTDGLEL